MYLLQCVREETEAHKVLRGQQGVWKTRKVLICVCACVCIIACLDKHTRGLTAQIIQFVLGSTKSKALKFTSQTQHVFNELYGSRL